METTLKKIGILGGTFDPIHLGHLIIADQALNQLKLDEILFMPSGDPPHKDIKKITPSSLRLDMVKLAINKNNSFKASDFELRREGIIYTSDTLKLLKNANFEAELYFILGADSLLYIDKWHEPQEIFNNATIVVADRDHKSQEILTKIEELKQKYYNVNIDFISTPSIDISSHDIRERLANHKSVKYMVTEEVEEYIRKNKIYISVDRKE